MIKVVCSICGSSNMVKSNDVITCRDCGMSFGMNELPNLIKEVDTNTVKPVNQPDDEIKNLYLLARRAAQQNNDELALKYYEQIAMKCPFDWESNYLQVYHRAKRCKISDIGEMNTRLAGAIQTAVDLIETRLTNENEILNACNVIIYTADDIATIGFESAYDWWDGTTFVKNSFVQDMINYTYPCVLALYKAGDALSARLLLRFPQLKQPIINLWLKGINYHKTILRNLAEKDYHRNMIESYENKVNYFSNIR